MKRKTFCKLVMAAGVSTLVGCAGQALPSEPQTTSTPAAGSQGPTATATPTAGSRNAAAAATQAIASQDALRFPADTYTTETATVTTSGGQKQITYRLYKQLTYVANPVDANYQSMNVKVPVQVDGKDVDATNAPILFANSVGGYMSANVNGAAGGMRSAPPAGMTGGGASSGVSRNTDLALAAGYVVVQPGCRGRDNQTGDGVYYGKAPAAIVDLKSAVRYIRYNKGIMPGNPDWIVSTGVSAGGALSALLGASGSSSLYDAYFKQMGAAHEDDSILASACFCPITDLEHADMAYEWEFGATPVNDKLVDQDLSQQLRAAFAEYQASLKLTGTGGFGPITADNYGDYLVPTYLVPAANKYLRGLTDDQRTTYLSSNNWITWAGNAASFTFADYVKHIGRMKGLPAFDAFDLTAAENTLFGNATTNARHFTTFSLREAGSKDAEVDADVKTAVNLMNPMNFIAQDNSGCAKHWWLRTGTSDKDTAHTVIANLATSLENKGKDVNTLLYWDAGHGADQDPEDLIAWIGKTTGYTG